MRTLAPFIETLDGSQVDDLELWIDEKNKNIGDNAELYRSCALDHAILVQYIQSLPET